MSVESVRPVRPFPPNFKFGAFRPQSQFLPNLNATPTPKSTPHPKSIQNPVSTPHNPVQECPRSSTIHSQAIPTRVFTNIADAAEFLGIPGPPNGPVYDKSVPKLLDQCLAKAGTPTKWRTLRKHTLVNGRSLPPSETPLIRVGGNWDIIRETRRRYFVDGTHGRLWRALR
jgi:hypothetical protein